MEANILLWIQENLRADWLTPIVKCITYLGCFLPCRNIVKSAP